MMKTFAVLDYIVFAFVCCFSVGISAFFAWRDKNHDNPDNYFLGGRSMKTIPVAISFVVTFQSSNLFLGFPAESYAYGMQYCIQCVGVMVGYMVASIIVVPIFHPLRLTSIYEYYHLRYGTNTIRFMCAITGTFYYIFYMSVVMFGTAMALQSVTGIDYWIVLIFLASVAVLYTSIGGIKGVIWADVFQFVVMIAGILTVLTKTTELSGGFGSVLKTSSSRVNFFNFNTDPTVRHTFWNLTLGSIPLFFYITITQAGVQRVNSIGAIRKAKLVYIMSAPIYSLVWITVMLQGLTMYSFFTNKRCDPLAAGLIDNLNKIFPHTVMELFHKSPGLSGLFISALCSASLSTISSGLNSVAAIMYTNFICVFWNTSSKFVKIYLPKTAVVVFGIVAVVCALVLSNMKGPLGQILDSFMGALVGMEVGIYLTSVFFRKATVKGIVCGGLTGLVLVFWISLGQMFVAKPETPNLPSGPTDGCELNRTFTGAEVSYFANVTASYSQTRNVSQSLDVTPAKMNLSPLEIFYSISYMYFSLIGTCVVITMSVVVSLLTQPAEERSLPDNVTLPLSVFLPSCLKSMACCRQDSNKQKDTAVDINEMETMLEKA